MYFVLGIACIALGVRFTTTHPEVVFDLGAFGVTYYHLLFLAGALSFVRGIWKWVTD